LVILTEKKVESRKSFTVVSTNVPTLLIVLILGSFAYGCYSGWRRKKREEGIVREAAIRNYDDDVVLKEKARFDKKLEENIDLPDGICWKSAYIYRNLVSPWFLELMATTRYDKTFNRKVKDDFRTYIYELQQAKTSSFLECEAKDEVKRKRHSEEADISATKCRIIEDAFAAAAGQAAVEELHAVRSRDSVTGFDMAGTRMAPAGMRFILGKIVPEEPEVRP
jgi:hypothetical protein